MKVELSKPTNDNQGLSAEFAQVPSVFLQTYSSELLDWAANLTDRGEFLDLTLWNPPGATILSVGYQGKVRLRCAVAVGQTTKAVLLRITPADEEDVAKVRKHCEDLPSIMRAHQVAAEASRGKARGAVKAVFDLPDYFVERYGFELREWGRNMKSIGMVKTIVLREGTLSDLSPDPEIGAVLKGVKLQAKPDRHAGDELSLLISPATEMDKQTILKHVEKMQRIGIPARAQLVEPPRPGIPTIPNIIGAAAPADGDV